MKKPDFVKHMDRENGFVSGDSDLHMGFSEKRNSCFFKGKVDTGCHMQGNIARCLCKQPFTKMPTVF